MRNETEIPEEMRAYIEKAHKQTRESRPDENWRIGSADKPKDMAPYKQDVDEQTEAWEALPEDVRSEGPGASEENASEGLMNFAAGGEIPNQNDILAQLQPQGAGMIAPSIAPPPAAPSAMPPAAPAPAPMARPPMPPAAPAPTDQDYMDRANKMLGLSSQDQAGFMKLMGDNAQKAQIGAGIAGIGDAIASGGTLGKVNPGALHSAEEQIQGRTRQGLEAMQTIRGNQKESYEMGQKLRGNEPFSPEIQKALVTQFHIPRDLAGSPRDVIYKMLDPIAQTQLKEAELAMEKSYKGATLDLQKQQLAATVSNQKAEHELASAGRRSEAGKALAGRSTLQAVAGAIPGTAANAAKHTLEDEMNLGKGPMKVNSAAEYQALPPGTHYVDSFGTEKVKK